MTPYIDDLRLTVEGAAPRLLALGDASARRPAPGKWSPREIIGHLVDSACNNHQRFVRAQLQDDLVFTGYAQDEWVTIGRYQEADWPELVSLWRGLNLQIARVMAGVPADVRMRETLRHNFDEIGFEAVPQGRPATLDHLMRDYVAHLHHHLRQIFGE
jgi:hypothetical protein